MYRSSCDVASLWAGVARLAAASELLSALKDGHCLEATGSMEVVARDGHAQYHALFSIPLNDIYLDPRLDLRSM